MNWPNARERELAAKHYGEATPSEGGLACLLAAYRKELLKSFERLAVRWRLEVSQRGSVELRNARSELLREVRRLDVDAEPLLESPDAVEMDNMRVRWQQIAFARGFSAESVAHFEAAIDEAVEAMRKQSENSVTEETEDKK